MPEAVDRKYPKAPSQWRWQWVFPRTSRIMGEAIGFALTIVIIGVAVGSAISSINYAIGDRYLRVRIWRFPIRKFPIEDFEDAEVGVTAGGENWTNTIYMPTIRKRGVTLHRRSGMFRRLNLTPNDPARFVERIKSHPRFRAVH